MRDRVASFRYAIAGLKRLLATEHNARLHAFATVIVVCASIWLDLDRYEWCWITLAIAMVWFAEAINTAIERLGDAVTLEQSAEIGAAKDVAAAAVLIFSIAAAVIGILILGPAIWSRS
ncbi:MAG: diacylglycerol kinase family protein [Sphingomicrobium sp.]